MNSFSALFLPLLPHPPHPPLLFGSPCSSLLPPSIRELGNLGQDRKSRSFGRAEDGDADLNVAVFCPTVKERRSPSSMLVHSLPCQPIISRPCVSPAPICGNEPLRIRTPAKVDEYPRTKILPWTLTETRLTNAVRLINGVAHGVETWACHYSLHYFVHELASAILESHACSSSSNSNVQVLLLTQSHRRLVMHNCRPPLSASRQVAYSRWVALRILLIKCKYFIGILRRTPTVSKPVR